MEIKQLCPLSQVLLPGTRVAGQLLITPKRVGRFSLTFIHSSKLVLGHVAQHQTASSLLEAQLWKKSTGE